MRKKLFLSILACLFAVVHTSAQEQSFKQNDNVVNVGVGFGGVLHGGYGSNLKQLPTFTATFERCIIGNLFNDKSSLGIGGLVGYTSSKYDGIYSDWGWKTTDLMVGARGALHYAFVSKLDTYAGVLIGLNFTSWKYHGSYDDSNTTGTNSLVYTAFAGARYYFADSFAVFAELGHGYSLVNAGISIKF
jgi:hypothetical protein